MANCCTSYPLPVAPGTALCCHGYVGRHRFARMAGEQSRGESPSSQGAAIVRASGLTPLASRLLHTDVLLISPKAFGRVRSSSCRMVAALWYREQTGHYSHHDAIETADQQVQVNSGEAEYAMFYIRGSRRCRRVRTWAYDVIRSFPSTARCIRRQPWR